MAAMGALKHFRKPEVEVSGDQITVVSPDPELMGKSDCRVQSRDAAIMTGTGRIEVAS